MCVALKPVKYLHALKGKKQERFLTALRMQGHAQRTSHVFCMAIRNINGGVPCTGHRWYTSNCYRLTRTVR